MLNVYRNLNIQLRTFNKRIYCLIKLSRKNTKKVGGCLWRERCHFSYVCVCKVPIKDPRWLTSGEVFFDGLVEISYMSVYSEVNVSLCMLCIFYVVFNAKCDSLDIKCPPEGNETRPMLMSHVDKREWGFKPFSLYTALETPSNGR